MTTLIKLFKSTTFRLLVLFAVLFATAATLVIVYISWNSNRVLEGRLRQTILAETLGLAEQYRSGGVSKLAKIINRRIITPSNALYLVTDREGGWIAGNVKSLTRDLWNRKGRVEFAYQRTGPRGREMRHAVARTYRLARGYRLMVGRDVEDQRQFTQIIRKAVLSGLAFMVFVGLGGGWLVSRALLKRIDGMTKTCKVIMAGDLSDRVPIDGTGDEIDRLAINLNAMLERMEQLMNGLREVSDNIAHDLKTPLSRMRNRVELALRDPNREDCREVLEKTIEESDELIRTFNALLSIARLEARSNNANFAPNDLQNIISDVAELYEPLAEQNNMQLVVTKGEPIQVDVDRQMIGQAIANLLDNALKYAVPNKNNIGQKEPQRTITIEAGAYSSDGTSDTQAAFYIAVTDNGPGIPVNDVEHAMKRFGRLEKSRSKPGTGLGLSLVSAVAKLHGGSLSLEENHPGLIARLIIPHNPNNVS